MGTGHLGHVLLDLSWVGLFVLLCDKKVMWICHLIKQIFHSSSKNRSDISLHILLAVVEYLLSISKSDGLHHKQKNEGLIIHISQHLLFANYYFADFSLY